MDEQFMENVDLYRMPFLHKISIFNSYPLEISNFQKWVLKLHFNEVVIFMMF